MKSKSILALLALSGILIVGLWWYGSRRNRIDSCLNEVSSAFETFFTVGCAERELFYGYGSSMGNELYKFNPYQNCQERIDLPVPLMRVFSTSPDNRYLLLKGTLLNRNNNSPPDWMLVLDLATSKVAKVRDMQSIGKFPVWINDRMFIFVGENKENCNVAELGERLELRSLTKLSGVAAEIITNAQQELVYMRKGEIAFEARGEIAVLDLNLQRSTVISDFKGQFDSLSWLNVSKETGCFLFCAATKGQDKRNLFLFNPNTKQTTRLTTEHTYNGKWLQQGKGYAYVGNQNNSFYLAIRPSESDRSTNLFK